MAIEAMEEDGAGVKESLAPLSLAEALAKVEASLPESLPTLSKPVLLMISGLPGAGKSHVARKLMERTPFVIIEADWVRKTLFAEPDYSGEESILVHRTCRALMEKLLAKGVPVIYDATNLIEYQRGMAYHLARKTGVKLVVVRVTAPEEVIRERLEGREKERTPEDVSDATWGVYKRMAEREQPIERAHLVIDTSQDLEEGIRKILREIRR